MKVNLCEMREKQRAMSIKIYGYLAAFLDWSPSDFKTRNGIIYSKNTKKGNRTVVCWPFPYLLSLQPKYNIAPYSG